MTTTHDTMDSPIGPLTIAVHDGAVTMVAFGPVAELATDPGPRDQGRAAHVVAQLRQYFAGGRRHFDVELAPDGTPFQQRVWTQLRRIPYGETCSYLDIAMEVGGPTNVRAVGAANGANPIAVIVPCHRVIGADGSLVGYAGGLDRKRRLLDLEAGVDTLFR